MNADKKVLYPNQLLEEMQIEGTIFPKSKSNMGVATLSHEVNSKHILRIYHLLLNDGEDNYEVIQELAAFTFEDRDELLYFLDDLPDLNGLEMLMLLNPFPQNNLLVN